MIIKGMVRLGFEVILSFRPGERHLNTPVLSEDEVEGASTGLSIVVDVEHVSTISLDIQEKPLSIGR